LAQGVPVVSIDRGGIKPQVGPAGVVFGRDEDFPSSCTAWIRNLVDAPETLSKLKLDSRNVFLNDRRTALYRLDTLFSEPFDVLHPPVRHA